MTTTVTAADNAPKVLISQAGRKGDPGTNGTNGDGFNQVRKSLLDNPLCHLFKTNKLVETSAPTSTDTDVTWNRSTSATYLDRYGVVKTASINTPREEKEGFLIEGASTNIIVYSEQFDNGAWPKSNINVTANATTAPDGTTSADLLTGVANSALTFQQKNIANSTKYTFSLFVKNSTLTTDSRLNVNNGSVNFNVFFNLVSGTITSVTAGFEGSIKTLDNGWFRVTATFLSHPSTSLASFYIVTSDQEAGSFYAWGAQVEQLSTDTSYIPTVASSVTRTADAVSVQVNNNAAQLDVAMSITMNVNIKSQSNAAIILSSLTLGALNFKFRSFVDVTNSVNVNQFGNNDINVGSFPLSQNVNHTITYDNESMVLYRDGVYILNTPYIAPTSFIDISSEIRLGSDTFGNSMFGHIKDFRTYDFKLNANEVEYLSA